MKALLVFLILLKTWLWVTWSFWWSFRWESWGWKQRRCVFNIIFHMQSRLWQLQIWKRALSFPRIRIVYMICCQNISPFLFLSELSMLAVMLLRQIPWTGYIRRYCFKTGIESFIENNKAIMEEDNRDTTILQQAKPLVFVRNQVMIMK